MTKVKVIIWPMIAFLEDSMLKAVRTYVHFGCAKLCQVVKTGIYGFTLQNIYFQFNSFMMEAVVI